jgi:hypothetical protein
MLDTKSGADVNLQEFFDNLTDEELIRRVSAGGLTEEALLVALAELGCRGISDPRDQDAAASSETEEFVELAILEKGLPPDEAQQLAGCLQCAGIPYVYGDIRRMLDGRRAVVVSLSLLVPPALLAEAQEAVAAYNRGDLAIDENFDPAANG